MKGTRAQEPICCRYERQLVAVAESGGWSEFQCRLLAVRRTDPALQNSVMDERHINQERDVILRSRRPSSAEDAAASSRAVAAFCAFSCASATRASWEPPGAINSKNSGAATSVFRSSVPVLHRAPIRALSKNFPGARETFCGR
jgi:hypothetical protein